MAVMDTISTKRIFFVILFLGVVTLYIATPRFDFSYRMLQSNHSEGKQLEILSLASADIPTVLSEQQSDDVTQTPITQHMTKIPKVLAQGRPPGSGSYHKVTGAEIWVYSVFYEPARPGTQEAEIRALGFGYLDVKFGKIICEVTNEDSTKEDYEATLRWAADQHKWGNINGSACFLECLVHTSYQPRYVKFYTHTTERNSATDEFNFPILYRAPRQRRFTVCYSVFFGGVNQGNILVNAVEYNRLMGADHFYVYIQKVGLNFQNIIDFYVSKGLMTALEMPEFPSNYAWYHGQIVAINDCFQRNKGISEYVLVNDLDEYIIPLRHTNLLELIEFVKRKEKIPNTIGSFSFLNSFYCWDEARGESWENIKDEMKMTKEEESLIKKNSVWLFYMRLHEEVYSYPSRSKTLHRPELVYEPGIHYAHKLLPNIRYIVINETYGYSAHFRSYGKCHDEANVLSFYRPYLNKLMHTQNEIQAYLHNKK